MLISLIVVCFITFTAMPITFLFARRETLMWRFAAGNVIGSAIYGTFSFLVSDFFGLSIATTVFSSVIFALILLLYFNKSVWECLKDEWGNAKGKLQNPDRKRYFSIAYYGFFAILFLAFFSKAMIVTPEGIFTGASQNLGDLPFHLGAITSFLFGENFPPQNPSFAYAKFTYPFIADYLSAAKAIYGADIGTVMFVENVGWAFSLLVILERFAFKITDSKLAGKIAPVILVFSGGLGVALLFRDLAVSGANPLIYLASIPRDFTIGTDNLRWGNSMVVLFTTQRGLLLGLPLTLIVFQEIWKWFSNGFSNAKGHFTYLPPLVVGLIAGLLPLVHVHSLMALFVVCVFLFFASIQYWRGWFIFAGAVAIFSVPELIWTLAGSATNTTQFYGWHWGWDARGNPIIWFWFVNAGIFIPLVFAGAIYGYLKYGKEWIFTHCIFLAPFTFIFIACNVFRFAPWEWDNIKLLIYWFVGSIPFVALFLAASWKRGSFYRVMSVAMLLVLISSGAVDIFRQVAGQIQQEVFSNAGVEIAEKIRQQTSPHAVFLNAPTYNSAVVLTGRRSLLRYVGHLSSYGINYEERENDTKLIYAGAATADLLLKKYGINYVMISPRERDLLVVNDAYFSKFKLIAEVGDHKVYLIQ